MEASSTIKLSDTMEWTRRLSFGRRSALGTTNEPALTSANTVLQTIVGAPFAWRWNRVVTGFITTIGQQDYTLFNWSATTQVKLGWLTVDDAGNCQKVTTAGATGSVPPTWNHTLGATTTDGGAVWTNIGSIGQPVSQTYSLGWIETVSVKDTNGKWTEIQNKLCLGVDSAQGRPRFIAAQTDDGQGNVTFRLMSTPDQAYSVAITLQQKPPLFAATTQTWSPIPDELSHIFNWGFLELIWVFADDARVGFANQKFVTQLLAASDGLDETQKNIFLANWAAVTGTSIANTNKLMQGTQARGA